MTLDAPAHGSLLALCGLSYAWTNTGNQFTFALTAGGSDSFQRLAIGRGLAAGRRVSLTLPGYYYQEISARRFVHFSAAYVAPLSADHRWQLRLGAASAYVDYLPGFEQPGHWHTGAPVPFTSRSEVWRVILRYGYGFNALRDGQRRAQRGRPVPYDLGNANIGMQNQTHCQQRLNPTPQPARLMPRLNKRPEANLLPVESSAAARPKRHRCKPS